MAAATAKRPREEAASSWCVPDDVLLTDMSARRRLGAGTYGSVTRVEARDAVSGHALTLAVKRVGLSRYGMGGDADERDTCDGFERLTDDEYAEYEHDAYEEAIGGQLLSDLAAPSFPAFYGLVRQVSHAPYAPQTWHYVTEYLGGSDAYAPRLRHDLAQVRPWLFQLLWSLMVAQYRLGFRHQDLKEANLLERPLAEPDDCTFRLYGSGGELAPVEWRIKERRSAPVMIDFGLSTWMHPTRAPHQGYAAASTYPSPDLLFWPHARTSRRDYSSDIWTLGYVTLNILTGNAVQDFYYAVCEATAGASAAVNGLLARLPEMRRLLGVTRKRRTAADVHLFAHWVTVLVLMHAVHWTALPPASLVPAGASERLDALRGAGEVDAILFDSDPATAPLVDAIRNLCERDVPLGSLLRRMLAWPSCGAYGAESERMAYALVHDAYFAPLQADAAADGAGQGVTQRRATYSMYMNSAAPLYRTPPDTNRAARHRQYVYERVRRCERRFPFAARPGGGGDTAVLVDAGANTRRSHEAQQQLDFALRCIAAAVINSSCIGEPRERIEQRPKDTNLVVLYVTDDVN
jgi:serine/threonine protein kinase